jgi:hypothetical protein
MKIAATLVPLLVAASATVASASPSYSASGRVTVSASFGTASARDHRSPLPPPPARANDRDHRAAPTYPPFPARHDVRTFARPSWTINPPRREMDRWTRFGTVSTGKQQVLAPQGARFNSVDLQVSGRVYMAEVAIEFDNHQTQVVQVRRFVDARNPLAAIDLAGSNRSIIRVIVYTTQARGGEVTVLAR